MSREIKFRAWDTEAKRMGEVSTCHLNIGKVMYISDNWDWYKRERIIMQYTGLKDKNGKEIYEGDILQCEIPVEIIDNGCNSIDGETILAEVMFEDGCFWAKGQTVNYPWVLDGDKTILSWLFAINAYDRYKIKVGIVGNIYENKELLEVVSND